MAANRRKVNTYSGNRYYVDGNVAYDTQPAYLPEAEEVVYAPRPRTVKKVRKKRDLWYVFQVFVCVSILFLGCMTWMVSSAHLAQKRIEIQGIRDELAQLKNMNNILSAEITEQIDLDTIREQAINRLGMAEPQPYQMVYLDIPRQSYTVEYQNNVPAEENGYLKRVMDFLKRIEKK